MLRDSDECATSLDCLPPLGQTSDRAAAHYYRSQHARAVQRERQWKERALAGERIIKQLLVLVGWCVQQIEGFKRQLAWLKQQQFGCKSEATRATDGVAEPDPAAGSEPTIDTERPKTTGPTRRRRGQ